MNQIFEVPQYDDRSTMFYLSHFDEYSQRYYYLVEGTNLIPLGTFLGFLRGMDYNTADRTRPFVYGFPILFSRRNRNVMSTNHIVYTNTRPVPLPTYADYLQQPRQPGQPVPLVNQGPQVPHVPHVPHVPLPPPPVGPLAQQGPQHGPQHGVAYEVHRHFAKLDYEKFMGVIRHEITPVTSGNELLEPLIDYARTHYNEKVGDLVGINDTVNMYSQKDIRAVQDVIKFVLGQPEDFKKTYIDVFVKDCLEAYPFNAKLPEANRKSCIKGQYERVFLSMKGAIQVLCLGRQCPPLYIELLKCFKPDYDAFFSEWFYGTQDPDADGYSAMNSTEKVNYMKEKKAELRAFIVERLGYDIESIDEYLNNVIQGIKQFEAVYEPYNASGKRRKNKSRKGVLKVIKTRAKPKTKSGKKTRGKKDKSHKK